MLVINSNIITEKYTVIKKKQQLAWDIQQMKGRASYFLHNLAIQKIKSVSFDDDLLRVFVYDNRSERFSSMRLLTVGNKPASSENEVGT